MISSAGGVLPFHFRYLTSASTSLPLPTCTDETGGYQSPYKTNFDNKEEQDYADDTDETDDGSNPQTGLLADSGTQEDEA